MSLIDLNDELDVCIHLVNAVSMMADSLQKYEGSALKDVAYVIEQKLSAISEQMGVMIGEANP